MKKRRLVITGMGIVSCFGNDVDKFYEKLLAGESGIKEISAFDCSEYPTKIAGEIGEFDTGDYLDKKQARRVDPYISYAVVAGKKALEQSGLLAEEELSKLDKTRCGILIGSGMGGMSTFATGVETLMTKGYKRISPFFIPYIITNMAGGLLAIDLGFMGPNYSVSSACATGNHAILAAADHIRNGQADLMICGGAEAPIKPIGLTGFIASKTLSENNANPKQASRPWDQNRDGFVMGEGAGVLVLEELEHAKKRGANIICEYLGGGLSCDAYHITDLRPDGIGVKQCIEMAIADAGIKKEEINYINAHATSTPAGDLKEIEALRQTFGDQLKNISINASKSIIGHCLGAAGGVEAIVTIKAIVTGKLHPTLNLTHPEEAVADLDLVPLKAKEKKVTAALSNSFGFGGHNASLIFAPYVE